MAGIGFELKKLFSRKGILANLQAYGYSGIVCAGPMLLGFILLLGMRFIAVGGGATKLEQDLLIQMFTYTLLASLILSTILSMVVTRFSADMMYQDKLEYVLPSYFGSTALLLVIGSLAYGTFLYFSGVKLIYQLLSLLFFCELVAVWMQINYITAIKEYRKIVLIFFLGIALALGCGYLFMRLNLEVISSLLAAACIGYGVIIFGYSIVLQRFFPRGKGSNFRFLEWIDRHPSLMLTGFFITVGMFGHLVITWFGPISVHVQGLYYGAPQYDIPAIMAFLSILMTTINFVTSVEVNYYPKHKRYFALLNEKGSLKDIDLAEKDMMAVLKQELNYLAQKQLVVAILFIVIGGPLLMSLDLGFTETMLGTFRILCVGYGIFAIANSIMLSLTYLGDYKGAVIAAFLFMTGTVAGTVYLMYGSQAFYGFGFLFGSAVMYVFTWIRLHVFTKKLQFNILCSQPVFIENKRGLFTVIARKLVARADRKENEKGAFPVKKTAI